LGPQESEGKWHEKCEQLQLDVQRAKQEAWAHQQRVATAEWSVGATASELGVLRESHEELTKSHEELRNVARMREEELERCGAQGLGGGGVSCSKRWVNSFREMGGNDTPKGKGSRR